MKVNGPFRRADSRYQIVVPILSRPLIILCLDAELRPTHQAVNFSTEYLFLLVPVHQSLLTFRRTPTMAAPPERTLQDLNGVWTMVRSSNPVPSPHTDLLSEQISLG